MRLVRLTTVLIPCILAVVVFQLRADDARQTESTPPPAATPAQQGQPAIVPAPAVPVQAQAAGVITLTAQAVSNAAVPGTGTISIDANGVKQVQNEEYGKKINITDDPQKGIKIEHTAHKGGTDETKTYQAKNVAELEKKSPEGFKLYQQYLGNQAGAGTVAVQGQGMLVPAGPGLQALPAPFSMPAGGAGGIQVIPGQVIQGQAVLTPAGGGLPIEVVTDALGQLRRDIKSAADSGAWKDSSKESKAAMKKQAAAMRKQLLDLEKQIEEK